MTVGIHDRGINDILRPGDRLETRLEWQGPDPILRPGLGTVGKQASFSPRRHGDREKQGFWRAVRERLIIHRAKRHRFPSPCLRVSVSPW
jgi:hypothetical protein